MLVLLINYADTSTSNTNSEFQSLLFGSTPGIATGPGSVRDYYKEVSYSLLDLSSGPSGIRGWYKASHTHDYYGSDNSTSKDVNSPELVREAVTAAANEGLDFSQYDANHDGYVDALIVVHQGTGQEETGKATDIWSYSCSLSTCSSGAMKVGSVYVDRFVLVPERHNVPLWFDTITNIGVVVHEFGHVLGLPDLYDTEYDSKGAGVWSVMAAGSWNSCSSGDPGNCPAHMDAWSKYRLGWVSPVQVSGTLVSETITAAYAAPDVYQLLTGNPTAATGEYFLVENRHQGGFDAGLPAGGLLIWHIDESVATNNGQCYPGGPTCSSQHYHVAVEQADGRFDLEKNTNAGDSGDPFRNGNFNASTMPSSNLYSGTTSHVVVSSIGTDQYAMTATLSAPTISDCSWSVGQGTNGAESAAFESAYSLGGGRLVLGCATEVVQTNGFVSFNGTTSHYQQFEEGDIEYHTNGSHAGQAFSLIQPIYLKWSSFGFNASNPVGYPIDVLSTESSSGFGTTFKYQTFEGGSLNYHLSGSRSGNVFEVHGAISSKWAAKGYANKPLGLPVSDEYSPSNSGFSAKTGRGNNFEGGHIYWISGGSQAYETHGSIDALYATLGGPPSWLGFPTSDEYVATTGYARNDFEGGYITTLDGFNYQAFHSPPNAYTLTVVSSPTGAGTITSSDAKINCGNTCAANYSANAQVQLTANPNSGYVFATWTGGGCGSSANCTVTMSAPVTATAYFNNAATISVTVTTNTAGPSFTVDGNSYTSSKVFNWIPGSSHTIATSSPQGSGTRYAWSNWSDGGSISHIVTPTTNTTYTANFNTQYQLTTAVSPSGAGMVIVSPGSGDGYYNANTSIQLVATPNTGYVFATWTGGACGSSGTCTFPMTAPTSITAYFNNAATISVIVTSNPAGRSVTVDGTTYNSQQTFNWIPGNAHTLTTTTPQGSGTRYTFSSWSDGGAVSHTVSPTAAVTYTANFTTQYQLTTAASPLGSGTISASPSTSDSYYSPNTAVQLTAAPNTGYVFTNFTGDLTGNTNPQSVSMTAPRSVTANFTVSGDTTPPQVSIVGLSNGGFVADTATVTANAVDNVGVAGVRFTLDGNNYGSEITAPPYSFQWNSKTATNGAHTWVAIARDAAGNTALSPSVTVNVINYPPTAVTTAATNVSESVAVLNGTLTPNGGMTNAWFQWGTSPTLAALVETTHENEGWGSSQRGVVYQLNGLSSNTTYYFRLVASNGSGSAYGDILNFTTAGQKLPAVTLSTSQLAFGTVLLGSMSSKTITLNNSGTADLVIFSISATTGFEVSTCPNTLAPKSTCTIAVSFHPSQMGVSAGSVIITHNAIGSPSVIPVTGNGGDLTLSLSRPGTVGGVSSGAPSNVVVSRPGRPQRSATNQISIGETSPTPVVGNAAVQASSEGRSSSQVAKSAEVDGILICFGEADGRNQTVTVRNTADRALTLKDIAISGEFLLVHQPCPNSLRADEACRISFRRARANRPIRGKVRIATDRSAFEVPLGDDLRMNQQFGYCGESASAH